MGKSSLFNWLVQRRVAIVDDVAGVTRDRMIQPFEHDDRTYELVDTGGIGIVDADNLADHVEAQIAIALTSADVILFVVDSREGTAPLDTHVAERLRRLQKPAVLVANKTDDPRFDSQAAEFFGLGFGEPVVISVHQNRGRGDLLEAIEAQLPAGDSADEADPIMKLAIVGRRNVGKSTFVNTLAEEERMIVSEVPGTTRDSVDVHFELDGKRFIAIDTPGLRRRRSLADSLEFYSLHRAEKSIRRADVVLLFFDSSDEVSRVDRKLVDYIEQQFKPCIYVANKWDLLADKTTTGEFAEYVRDEFRTTPYVPIAFVTGQTGRNVKTLVNHAQMLFKQANERVSAGKLNRLVQQAMERTPPPPLVRHRRPKVFYTAQVSVAPPTIVMFCSDPKSFKPPYRKYLVNYFREALPYAETADSPAVSQTRRRRKAQLGRRKVTRDPGYSVEKSSHRVRWKKTGAAKQRLSIRSSTPPCPTTSVP